MDTVSPHIGYFYSQALPARHCEQLGAGLTSAGVLRAVSVTTVPPEQMMASLDIVTGEQGTD